MSRRERPRPKQGLKLGAPRDEGRERRPLYDDSEDERRTEAVQALNILDTPTEERFDEICREARDAMGAPATYISLLEGGRQWFKSTVGMGDVRETPREGTFCDFAVRRSLPTVVLDATQDPLFCQSPYVVEGPKVRFYAGVPLVVRGQRVGTLCALDFAPREAVTEAQMSRLEALARKAEQELSGG